MYQGKLHFNTSLTDLERSWFKVTGESKNWANYGIKFWLDLNGIWYTVETCWSNEPHSDLILSSQYSIERSLLLWFCKRKFDVGLYSDIYRVISFKLGVVMETTKLCILILVSMTSAFIQDHSCMRNQIVLCQFSQMFCFQFGKKSDCCHNLLVCWSCMLNVI